MRDSEIITAPLSAQRFSWPLSWVAHYFVAVDGAMIIGFLPEAVLSKIYYNTGLEPYSPMIAITAFLLGYFVSLSIFEGRASTFVWVIGLAWMVIGIYAAATSWSASWSPEKTRWGYVLANLFGPTLKCSGTECFEELFFTTPFTASVTYSIGAYTANRSALREA